MQIMEKEPSIDNKSFSEYVKEVSPQPIKNEQSYTTARIQFENRQLAQMNLIEDNIQ